jgi:bifunctional UDP-N-acetylglucosamine pyrophosphorylase/glucosamine-1-phosphate N-acetyltransferase
VLSSVLPRLGAANAQGERYLTDAVAIARSDGLPVGTVSTPDPVEIEGVNDRVQLAELSRVLRDRLVRKAQLAGVTVMDPATTWIHADVTIGPDTVLYPDTSLEAGTTIGSGCRIGPATTLFACTVDDGATVLRSHCEGAQIGPGAMVGPFTYLRPEARLAERAKAGAFVEVKKSTIGTGAKVPHLSYVGDATIGAGANLGAGTITANYDGVRKSETVIGENVFIGTNSTLVAPVTIAPGAYIAAGSTVTDGVAAGALAVARGRQHNSAGWVLRRRAGTAADAVARAAGATDPSSEEDSAR